MSAWIPATPPRPVRRSGALGAAHLGPADAQAGPGAGLEVAAEPLDQRREVRLVPLRRLQVGGDAGQHFLERLAEHPVHVVPPDLAELAPVTLDGREVLGQVVIEPHQVRPELGQRLDIVDNPRHAPYLSLRVSTWCPGLAAGTGPRTRRRARPGSWRRYPGISRLRRWRCAPPGCDKGSRPAALS